MNVIRARALGMCFGVRDALHIARDIDQPAQTTIYGELVHNPEVSAQLAERGLSSLPEGERDIPATPRVLVTAHGLSDRERTRLLEAGKQLIDTTCPLVRRAHDAARTLEARGWFVVIIGKRTHVEVLGITGDLLEFEVISHPSEARDYNRPRIGVMCQTTTPPAEAEQILAAIRSANPQSAIRFVDTICRPTRERQEAAMELLDQVEAMVVVGGRHSNNTRQLVRLAESRGVPVQHVETAAELDLQWLAHFHTVGLTAGTSTLDSAVDEVHERLTALQTARMTA